MSHDLSTRHRVNGGSSIDFSMDGLQNVCARNYEEAREQDTLVRFPFVATALIIPSRDKDTPAEIKVQCSLIAHLTSETRLGMQRDDGMSNSNLGSHAVSMCTSKFSSVQT